MSDVLFWSGGKDAWIALQYLREKGRRPVLLTTCSRDDGWVKFQGVTVSDIRRQTLAMDLELRVVELSEDASNEEYVKNVEQALEDIGASTLVFGDLHLEDIRTWREGSFPNFELEFPNWRMGPANLAYEFWNRGGRAIVTAVQHDVLRPERAGELYTPAFVASLPAQVDAAGEGGEFHTFVVDGGWDSPIELEVTGKPWSDGFMTYALARN